MLKKTYSKTHTYIYYSIITIIKFIFAYFMISWLLLGLQDLNVINKSEDLLYGFTYYASFIFILLLLFFIMNYVKIIIIIMKQKKNKKIEIKISENGIYDSLLNMSFDIVVKWDIIKRVITTKNSIVILTSEKNVSLFYPRNNEIIEAIEKYKKNI